MKPSLVFGLCMLLLLAGCGYRQGTQIQDVNVHTGTKGITVKFLDTTKITYSDSATAITYELANEGASDVEGGVLSLGIEDDFLTLEGDKIRYFTIDGKSLTLPLGDKQVQSIQLRTKTLPPQTETVTTNVALNICYPYITEAEMTICVDTDVFGRVTTKPCKSAPISLGSQGAPVSVTKVEPSYTPQTDPNTVRAEFLIYVRNVGGGQLYEYDKSLEACTPQALGPNSWNVAMIRAYLGDAQLDCSPKHPTRQGREGYLQLIRSEDFVRCSLDGGVPKIAGTYTSTMRVEVEYGYTQTLTTPLQIKRLV